MAPVAWGPGSVTCEDDSIDVPAVAIPSLPVVRRASGISPTPRRDAKSGWKSSRNGAQTALGRLEASSPSQWLRAARPSQIVGREGARTACGRLEDIRDSRLGISPRFSAAQTPTPNSREGAHVGCVHSPEHSGERARCLSAMSGILAKEPTKMKTNRRIVPRVTLEAAPILDNEKQEASTAAAEVKWIKPEVLGNISQLQSRIASYTSRPYDDDDRRFSERFRSRSQQGAARAIIEQLPVRAQTPCGRIESVVSDTIMGETKCTTNASLRVASKNIESGRTAKSFLRRSAHERDKSMDKSMLNSDAPIVHAIIPADHRGFELGGRNGNLVVQVHGGQESFVHLETSGLQEDSVALEKGWKVIGFDFKLCPIRWIKAKIMKARLQKRECCVTFEVTRDAAARLGKSVCKQSMARFFLEEHFNCKSLKEIEQLDTKTKQEFLRNPKLVWLMVNAKATMELEVLLGAKNATMLQLSLDMRRALRLGSSAELEMLMQHEMAKDALLQKDAGGNVVLHYCKNLSIVRFVLDHNPQAKDVRNSSNQLPLHSYLMCNPEDAEALHVLSSCESDLFQRDGNGISPAMLSQGSARELVEKLVTPWEDMKEALQLHYSKVLEALQNLEPCGLWPALLSFHCFGEPRVWKDGCHTTNSRTRSEVVWGCIAAALQSLLTSRWPFNRDTVGARVAQVLLEAAMGPRHERLDPREVYRQELTDLLAHIDEGCRRILHGHYRDLVRAASAEWLLSTPSEIDLNSCAEELVTLGLKPRLQFRMPPPAWVVVPDLQDIFDDLQQRKIIGKENKGDAVHDLLRITNICSELDELDADNDVVVVRWYAAWLQSICYEQEQALSDKVESNLGISNGVKNREALKTMSLEDVCQKIAHLLRHLERESATAMPPYQGETSDNAFSKRLARCKQKVIRGVARLVHDMNVLSITAKDTDELYKLYEKVLQSGMNIVRTDNAFSRSAKILSSFRDLKISVECHTDSGPLLVDLQLNLNTCIAERRLSSLCDLFFQGKLDWHHVFVKSRVRNVRQAKESLRDALKKKHAPSVLAALNHAAKVGVDENHISMIEEALAKLTDDLLQKAIEERNTSMLQSAINVAICIPTETCITEAVRLLEQLEKEATERHVAAEMIATALLRRDIAELRQALLKAQSCNLESEQVSVAEELFEKHIDMIEERMSDALNLKDFVAIANALRDAWNAGLEHEGIERAQEILQELQALDGYAKAVENKDPQEIKNALLEMKVLDLQGPDVDKAEALWRTLQNVPLRLREYKKKKAVARLENPWEKYELHTTKESQHEAEVIRLLENALKSQTPATLNAAISRARKIGVSCPQLTAAESSLKRFISEAETILLTAMTQTTRTGDHRGLYDAINTARSVGCSAQHIIKAEAVLSTQLASNALREAMASGDSTTLQNAIIVAASKEVQLTTIKTAEELLEKYRKASTSIREAMDAGNVVALVDLLTVASRAQVSEVIVRSAEECVARLQARAMDKLQLAISQSNLEDLHYGILEGKKAKLSTSAMEDAEKIYLDMKEDAIKTLKRISDDELDVSVPELQKDIVVAKLVGLDPTITRWAEIALARRLHLQKDVQEAVNTSDLGNIRAAISNAKKAGALAADLKDAYDYMAVVKANATAQLRKAMDVKDPTRIHEAIHDALNAGVDDNVLKDAEWLVTKLSQGFSLLQKAIKSKKGCCADLHNAISNAYALGLNSSEVGVAEQLLESWKCKSVKLLETAIKKKEPKALKQAIAEGKKSMLTDKDEIDILAKAEYLLYGYVTTLEEELKTAMKARDKQKLEETITAAWSSDIELKLIQDAKALLASLHEEEESTKELTSDGGFRKVVLGQCQKVYGLDQWQTRDSPFPTEEDEKGAKEMVTAPVIHT